MAKLYFRYGTVGSAKTLNLLAVAHNYKQQGKKVILLKPAIDDRFGAREIRTRAGLYQGADFLIKADSRLFSTDSPLIPDTSLEDCSCILVDEAQFLLSQFVEDLFRLTVEQNIPVICYGLKTNFRGHLFSGSLRLIELADAIEEVKTTCSYCNSKATFNLKLLDGHPVLSGKEVDLGAEEKYLPACKACYLKMHTGVLATNIPQPENQSLSIP